MQFLPTFRATVFCDPVGRGRSSWRIIVQLGEKRCFGYHEDYKGYLGTLFLDLAYAVLTCGAELVLPMIIRYPTNTAIENAALLSVKIVAELALLYFLLRVVDTLAAFYMAYQGHVMGTHILSSSDSAL